MEPRIECIPDIGEILDIAERRGANSELPWAWDRLRGLWLPPVPSLGAAIRDFSGFGYHMTPYNGPTWGADRFGHVMLFDDGNTEYVEHAGAAVSAAPVSMAAWLRSNDATAGQAVLVVSKGTDANYIALQARGDVGGDPLWARVGDAGGETQAVTSTGFSANQWHHGCLVYASSTDYRVWIDGGSKGTQNAARTPAGLTYTTIGASYHNSAHRVPFSGDIGPTMIWARALIDAQVEELAHNPLGMITPRPSVFQGYSPAVVYDETGLAITAAGSVSVTDAVTCVETGLAISAAGTVTESDALTADETGLSISAAATVTVVDTAQFVESTAVSAAGTVTVVDAAQFVDSLSVSAAGTVAVADTAQLVESLSVSAAGSVTVTDTLVGKAAAVLGWHLMRLRR